MDAWLKLSENDSNSLNGWLDPKGNYYPCQYGHHNDLMDTIIEKGYDTTLNDCEKTWVKLCDTWTMGFCIITFATKITPRQKKFIVEFIQKTNALKVGAWINCGPYMLVRHSETVVKFEK